MIYYFSGTGNSEWTAKMIAERMEEQTVRITVDTMQPITVHAGEVFGLVFPVYAWNMPEMVSEFVKGVTVEKGAYTFAVCTCGAEAGYTMKVLRARMPLDCAWSLIMPDTYIVAYKVEPEEEALQKVRAAYRRLDGIIDHLTSRHTNVFDVEVGSFALVKTFVGAHLFNKYARSSKPFRTTYACVGCGKCAELCPTHNITVVDGMPVWDKHCQQCLSCIHRCPKQAIEYGKSTEKHGRYYFHYTKEQIEEETE